MFLVDMIYMYPDPGPLASENSDQMIRFNLFRFLSGRKVLFHLSRKSYRKFHSNGKRSRFCILSLLFESYYRDRVVSIHLHTVFARRINVQVGTASNTSFFASLFYDCYGQLITTSGPSNRTLQRKVTEIETNCKFGGVPS